MSNNNSEYSIHSSKFLNGKNFRIWFDAFKNLIEQKGLGEYLTKDVVGELTQNKPEDKEAIKQAIQNNMKVRLILINTLTPKIHEEIIGIDTVSTIIQTLKTEYDHEVNDLTQWINKLVSIKAKNDNEIPNACKKIIKIFDNMKEAKASMDEKEKVKYFLRALPEHYKRKLMLDSDTTVNALYEKIKEDLKYWNYVNNWGTSTKEEEERDDPMEIDYTGKFNKRKNKNKNKGTEQKYQQNNNNKNNKYGKQNKKYCGICDMNNHNTKECYFNPKNPNSKFYKYYKNEYNNEKDNQQRKNKGKGYIGFVNDVDLNQEYENEINFDDIRPYLEEPSTSSQTKKDEDIKSINFINRSDKVNLNNKENQKLNIIKEEISNNKKNNEQNKIPRVTECLETIKNVLQINENGKTQWLYDSGAGEHITNNKNILKNFINEPITLKCANNTYCDFEGYGEYDFKINNHFIKLKRVLYSKDVAKNMISGIEFARTGTKVLIEEINNEVIMNLLDNNYKIIASFQANKKNEINITGLPLNSNNNGNILNNNNIMALQNFRNAKELIWHRRLGHFYNKDLNKYLKLHNVDDNCCDDCKIVKMKRSPHNKETPKANDIIEVIHSDIIGPINRSVNGYRFVLAIIDEFSRKSWIYLLKNKSEAVDLIIQTLILLNNQNKNNIKVFKSDGGKEFNNKKIKQFCKENGIYKDFSPPYNPENNGLVERFNQTIISSSKTMIYWSKMSDNFWDYAIKYANYIFNKVPHNSINNKIPDEIYYKKKANINHVRVFGCVTYYKDYSQNKHKFAPNSKKGVFLGFSERHNSYIVMDSEDHKIHHVREIYCKEDTPSEIRLPNTFKNEFNDPDFLNFNFNFTNNRLEPDNNWNTNENSNSENENQILITDDKNEKEINKNNENLILISENPGNDFKSNSQSNLNNEDIVINTNLENPLTVDNENNSNDSKITENNENINIQKSTLQNISDSENKIPISSEKNFINKNSSNFHFSDNNNNNSNENNINLLPNLDIKINKLFDSNNEENNTNNILQNTNDNIQNKNLDINNSNNENINIDKGNSNVNKKSSFNNRKSVKNLVIKNDVNVSNTPHSPTFGNKFSKFRKTNFNTKTIYSINYNVPSNFYQATHCKDHKLWEKAIKDELNNLYNNNIMDFVPFVPKGKTIITTRWVFACKFDSNGNIIKFKARLVARGFNQKFGIDFELTFSPTLNIDCLKLIFSLSAKFKWPIYQLDIKAAYLNANLDKEIYTTIPPGDTNFGRGYWKLNKALYGLKQSGRQWYITISTFLIEQGFHQLSSEKCLFKRIKNGKLVCLIGLYVDDMVITELKTNIIYQKLDQLILFWESK
eukprot:jgi/Orpsp1_1/1188972/evm.model.d7180000068605.1